MVGSDLEIVSIGLLKLLVGHFFGNSHLLLDVVYRPAVSETESTPANQTRGASGGEDECRTAREVELRGGWIAGSGRAPGIVTPNRGGRLESK